MIQDGKRTLIKNQLYLIEQLQLENAGLRNERDQLQLENEELKFQLQIISSSNILNQPGTAFESQCQLERLIENGAGQNGRLTGVLPADSMPPPVDGHVSSGATGTSHPTAHGHDCFATMQPSSDTRGDTDDNHCDRQSNFNQATPPSDGCSNPTRLASRSDNSSKQPIKLIDDDGGGPACADDCLTSAGRRHGYDNHSSRPNQLQTSSTEGLHLGQEWDQEKIDSHLERPLVAASSNGRHDSNQSPTERNLITKQANSYDHLISNGAVGPRESSGHDDNVCCNNNNALADGDDDYYDDGQRRAKLVERLYGDDSEKVQAAAVTIQRAFRKYQICKRFRTITEQLRHTCRSSSSPDSTPITGERHKRETNHQPATQDQAINSSGQSSIPFVTGATKAAAWESLSYAASRLAASAAAATATTRQVLANGVVRSASSQHVDSPSTGSVIAPATSTSDIHLASAGEMQTTQGEKVNDSGAAVVGQQQQQPRSLKSSNSVVAAAINFQQLESIRKRQYRVGLNIFNKSPEKGISFLIAHSFIDSSTPYSKSSPGYYLSNQMHFVDKQHLVGQNDSINQHKQRSQHKQHQQRHEKLVSALSFSSCQFCFEEENLKRNVAHFLLHRKGLAKEKIGQYLGNLQSQFNQDVLRYYLQELDFYGLQIDIALRKFLATLRLPGEAQKIERFVDYFAQRYVQCQQQQQQAAVVAQTQQQQQQLQLATNRKTDGQQQPPSTPKVLHPNNYKNNLTLLSRDEIFILTFAIIMLNTDLHSPSLKPTSRMSSSQFIHNLRGVFKSQTIGESDLTEIYERVKADQITTTPDHVSHVMRVQKGLTVTNFQKKELPNLCVPHRRLVCFCRLFEVYDINKKERIGQHQREIFLFNDMLLVTKLARRARANTPQQYAYRQSIALQGLYVQLFQTAYYNFGISLCRRSNDETLIMFNARNELDQSRFVEDLTESIAEMDEMESIRNHNVVEMIHSRFQEQFKRHAAMHDSYEKSVELPTGNFEIGESRKKYVAECQYKNSNNKILMIDETKENLNPNRDNLVELSPSATAPIEYSDSSAKRRFKAKFNSMSNLASVDETASCDQSEDRLATATTTTAAANGLRQNKSFVQNSRQSNTNQLLPEPRLRPNGDANTSGETRQSCSSASVHSLDSGMFLSRDVSPNQSG